MKTLTGSISKLCLVEYKDSFRSYLWCPRDVVLSRPVDNPFLGSAKHVDLSFSLSGSSSQRSLFHPILSVPALSSSDLQTQLQDEDAKAPDPNEPKTVRVKFQLGRECLFGQHFFIVGDDPMLGLWDPENAIPLNWSDGHIWTLELDVPVGKLVKYKFILKGGDDSVSWQPGDDRVLQTWETEKTITVVDNWENSEVQKLVEEEPSSDLSKEIEINSELLMVAENLIHSRGNNSDDVNKELRNGFNYSIPEENSSSENLKATVAENGIEKKEVLKDHSEGTAPDTEKRDVAGADTSESNRRAVPGKNLLVSQDETSLVHDEEFPVLVPGLNPMLTTEIEEPSPQTVEENAEADYSLVSDKAEESKVSEFAQPVNLIQLSLDEEPAKQASDTQEETTMLQLNGHENKDFEKEKSVEENHSCSGLQTENNVLEGDMQWGRRTLQKLLISFGLF